MSLDERVAQLLDRADADAAATALIEALGAEVLGYLRTLLRDPEEAEDVFSAFAENVWHGLPSWRREGTLRGWAYRVAWNAASRVHRDPYRRRRERLPTTMASRLALSVVAASHLVQDRQSSELDALRQSLTPEEQTLLTLRVDRELSWREVAEVLAGEGRAADEAALRKRFERLKERLAEAARARGLLGKP